MNELHEPSVITSLIAGGMAGITVDTTLFPLDTLKTRLQSPFGFWQSGGFRGLYKGIGPALAGSAPIAALFFCSYNTVKQHLLPHIDAVYHPLVHMGAASVGEVVSCLVKVPTEILKQRQQVGMTASNVMKTCSAIYSNEGLRGFYRGLSSTILREIPFSTIQFPVWELLMNKLRVWKQSELTALEKALCGAVAGGVAAAITTPLDVAKTRIMLSTKDSYPQLKVYQMLSKVYTEKGVQGLFAGFIPRTLWITLGGTVFFGSYELSKDICNIFM